MHAICFVERDTYIYTKVTKVHKKPAGVYFRCKLRYDSLDAMKNSLILALSRQQKCHTSRIQIKEVYFLGWNYSFLLLNNDDPRLIPNVEPIAIGAIYGNNDLLTYFSAHNNTYYFAEIV